MTWYPRGVVPCIRSGSRCERSTRSSAVDDGIAASRAIAVVARFSIRRVGVAFARWRRRPSALRMRLGRGGLRARRGSLARAVPARIARPLGGGPKGRRRTSGSAGKDEAARPTRGTDARSAARCRQPMLDSVEPARIGARPIRHRTRNPRPQSGVAGISRHSRRPGSVGTGSAIGRRPEPSGRAGGPSYTWTATRLYRGAVTQRHPIVLAPLRRRAQRQRSGRPLGSWTRGFRSCSAGGGRSGYYIPARARAGGQPSRR